MATIGIDIGGHTHVAARCREGQAQADRKILRLTQSRAGFAALDAWLAAEPEPIERVVMESSATIGWRSLHICVDPVVPGRMVNPLAARYLRKAGSNAPSPIRPMPGASPRWPCGDSPPARDPLAGVELRQSARFAMTLVTEQAKVCQKLYRLVELGFPELRELFEDPTCRTARAVLRLAPTASAATRRRTSTLANANAGPGRRRLGQAKAERLAAAAADSIAVPELDAEVAFEVRSLCSTSSISSSARSRRPRPASASFSMVNLLVDSEPSRESDLRSSRPSSPRSATSSGSTTSISLLAFAGVHPAERAQAARV